MIKELVKDTIQHCESFCLIQDKEKKLAHFREDDKAEKFVDEDFPPKFRSIGSMDQVDSGMR